MNFDRRTCNLPSRHSTVILMFLFLVALTVASQWKSWLTLYPLGLTVEKTSARTLRPDGNDMISITGTDLLRLTKAQRVWRLYQQQHSQQALEREYAGTSGSTPPSHRWFTVAYYWCPHRAGNVLHNFFNVITWAVIHNMTVLWDYDSASTPDSVSNSYENCQAIMPRADWMPSWQDWSTRLKLPDPLPISLHVPNATTDELGDASSWREHIPVPLASIFNPQVDRHMVVLFPQIPDVLLKRKSEVERCSWSHHPYRSDRNQRYLVHMFLTERHRRTEGEPIASLDDTIVQGTGLAKAWTNTQRRAANDAYSQGNYYWYGLLLRSCFSLPAPSKTRALTARFKQESMKLLDPSFSIVLHSRHTVAGDDGSFIQDEIKCLESVLHHRESQWQQGSSSEIGQSKDFDCHVYLLSDRPKTSQLLSNWIQDRVENYGCIPWTASIDPSIATPSFSKEHGPRAGVGFLYDLSLGALARDAVIGDVDRSSFALLKSLVVFGRANGKSAEVGQTVRSNDTQVTLLECAIPARRNMDGYDYGPGTPTFRHHSRLKPLRPVQLWQQYVRWHDQEAMSSNAGAGTHSFDRQFWNTNSYAVVLWDCSAPIHSRVRRFVNGTSVWCRRFL
jgi:hypothetical protein